MADRISISREWYIYGDKLLKDYKSENEPKLLFESYIYLWISLTIAAREYCACDGKKFDNQNGEKTTDKEEILYWARVKNEKIIEILENNKSLILELCSRAGSKTGKPIMDTWGKTVQFHEKFIRYWQKNQKNVDSEDIVKTFILILNRVRNNLFHGGKSFKVESDVEILELTCPLLASITKLCINTF